MITSAGREGAFYKNEDKNNDRTLYTLASLRYIGVASFSYANVPSEITWVDVNPSSGSGYGPGTGDNPGGGYTP